MIHSEKGFTVKKNFMLNFLKEHPSFCDMDYTFFHAEDDFLITPETIYKKRIFFKILEFETIIDSSNMNIIYWLQIAECIEKHYSTYDAFIILHGTDTMAYTSSALSFMFENLNKTVIITGSQVPLSLMRNDAYNNLFLFPIWLLVLLFSLSFLTNYLFEDIFFASIVAQKGWKGKKCHSLA